MSRPAEKPAPVPVQTPVRGDVVALTLTKTVSTLLDRAIASARDAMIGRAERTRLLAVRARSGLHHPGGVHHDDALPRRDRCRARDQDRRLSARASDAERRLAALSRRRIQHELHGEGLLRAQARRRRRRCAAHGARAQGHSRARRRGASRTCSRVSRSPCSASFPGAACPISPSRSCCCRSGSSSTSTRSRTGRAR